MTPINALLSSVSKLSSGSRINSASDDAADMAISELLRADIATAKQSSRNISDGVSMLQTAKKVPNLPVIGRN